MSEDFPFKEGDDVSYRVGDSMLGHGEIFQVLEGDQVIVKFGNGARGLEYVAKSQIIREK
jgi:hypothetical protein